MNNPKQALQRERDRIEAELNLLKQSGFNFCLKKPVSESDAVADEISRDMERNAFDSSEYREKWPVTLTGFLPILFRSRKQRTVVSCEIELEFSKDFPVLPPKIRVNPDIRGLKRSREGYLRGLLTQDRWKETYNSVIIVNEISKTLLDEERSLSFKGERIPEQILLGRKAEIFPVSTEKNGKQGKETVDTSMEGLPDGKADDRSEPTVESGSLEKLGEALKTSPLVNGAVNVPHARPFTSDSANGNGHFDCEPPATSTPPIWHNRDEWYEKLGMALVDLLNRTGNIFGNGSHPDSQSRDNDSEKKTEHHRDTKQEIFLLSEVLLLLRSHFPDRSYPAREVLRSIQNLSERGIIPSPVQIGDSHVWLILLKPASFTDAHHNILEHAKIKDGKIDAASTALNLGLHVDEVEVILDDLVRIGVARLSNTYSEGKWYFFPSLEADDKNSGDG